MNPPIRPSSLTLPEGYADWLAQFKSQIVQARQTPNPKPAGLSPVRYAEMVREYLKDHQKIRNAELRELLGLGDSPSAQVEASRYLNKWSEPDGFLVKVKEGVVHYIARKDI